MNHRFSNPWIRILAFLLAVLCLAGAFYCGISAVNCLERGFLRGDSVVYQESRQCAERVRLQGREVISQFQRNPQFQYWDKMLENTNLRFIILEEQTGDDGYLKEHLNDQDKVDAKAVAARLKALKKLRLPARRGY